MQLQVMTPEMYALADELGHVKRLECYATLNRFNALYAIQRAGSGHIGSSFSSAEIITWMHLEHPDIAFFSSKGHDAPLFYASLASIGRIPMDKLRHLRRPGGLPGHPELRTPGIIAHSGSLGMGISKAKGLIRANRLKGETQRVAVLLGDGELQEGQIWESLIDCDFEELIIIVDRNRLSTAAEPNLPHLLPRLRAFGYVVEADGHDFKDLESALAVQGSPLIIVANTTKGCDVSFMENQGEYHSGALDSNQYEAAARELYEIIKGYLPNVWYRTDDISTRNRGSGNPLINAYGAALADPIGLNPAVVVLDADLAGDCGLNGFRERFPQRFIECGIAEQDMVSQAGMLAAQGFAPIVHSFAAFLTRRANEQIYDNCHQKLPVVYVGTLAGILPDGPGPSHEALDDVAIMRTMPNMEIFEPTTVEDVPIVLNYAVNQAHGPVYIRFAANPAEMVRRA